MRDYAKIAPQFWTGETGRKIRRLGPEAVAIALYLLTCPHANAFGMYYLPLGYMACDVGMSPEGASEWLQKVCATGFCAYDEEAEVVWVRNMARFQIGEEMNPRDNRAKWIISEWLHLPKNAFLQDFYDVYGGCFGLPSLSEQRGFYSQTEAPSKPLPSLELEKELEKEERENTASAPPLASPAAERPFVSSPSGEGEETEQVPVLLAVSSPASRRGKGKSAEPPAEPHYRAKAGEACYRAKAGEACYRAKAGEACYRAKSGRYLTGKRLTSFERFWTAFAFAKGKAEAADAWLDIPALTDALVDEICRAAELEAIQRIEDTARGKSPKWPQGWLTARRWEDYAPSTGFATGEPAQPRIPVPPAVHMPTEDELEANKQRTLRHVQHMRERGILPGGQPPDRPQRCDFGAALAPAMRGQA